MFIDSAQKPWQPNLIFPWKFPRRPKPLQLFGPTGPLGKSSSTSSHSLPSAVFRCTTAHHATTYLPPALSGRGNKAPRYHLHFHNQNGTAPPLLAPFKLQKLSELISPSPATTLPHPDRPSPHRRTLQKETRPHPIVPTTLCCPQNCHPLLLSVAHQASSAVSLSLNRRGCR
jgi:hypothetical protein